MEDKALMEGHKVMVGETPQSFLAEENSDNPA